LDWRDACRHSTVVLRIRQSGGPDILTMVEAGMLARAGLNSAGIGHHGQFPEMPGRFWSFRRSHTAGAQGDAVARQPGGRDPHHADRTAVLFQQCHCQP